MNPEFLEVEDVLEIHELQLQRFGGSAGLRDLGLLESAVSQPKATFGGEFLHEDLFAMIAASLMSLVKNHHFVDGNKRTGLLSALVFLGLNGLTIGLPSHALYEATMSVAEGRFDKQGLAELLRLLVSQASEPAAG
jgi:death-on-curing protein